MINVKFLEFFLSLKLYCILILRRFVCKKIQTKHTKPSKIRIKGQFHMEIRSVTHMKCTYTKCIACVTCIKYLRICTRMYMHLHCMKCTLRNALIHAKHFVNALHVCVCVCVCVCVSALHEVHFMTCNVKVCMCTVRHRN